MLGDHGVINAERLRSAVPSETTRFVKSMSEIFLESAGTNALLARYREKRVANCRNALRLGAGESGSERGSLCLQQTIGVNCLCSTRNSSSAPE